MVLGKSEIKQSNGCYKIGAKCDECSATYFIKAASLKRNPSLGDVCQSCLHPVINLKCGYCGNPFTRLERVIKHRAKDLNSNRSFCSRKCFLEWSHENHRGIVGETIKCAHCGKTKYRRPSDMLAGANSKRRFCSMACQTAFRKKSRVTLSCQECGKPFVVRGCHKDLIKFCSKACKVKHWGVYEVVCVVCGKPKTIMGWDYKRNLTKVFYCSRECLRTGRLHPKKPTIFEQRIHDFLGSEFPGQWVYTGNGDLWINRQNPDFVHSDKKIVLEAQGCWWHNCKSCYPNMIDHPNVNPPIVRAANYAALGYQAIFVWEHDLKRSDWQEYVKSLVNDEVRVPAPLQIS